MKTIAVFWSNRSEEGLLKPVIEELKKAGFEVQPMKVPEIAEDALAYMESLDMALPDAAIVPYDRPTMAMMAWLCYHNNVPIVQLHAGDISSGTWDDYDRWCITAWATYHFCAGKRQAARTRRFLRSMGRDLLRVYNSGVTNLDDLPNMTECPDGDYDIVLYNPPTKYEGRDPAPEEIQTIFNMLNKQTYWMEPNGDRGSENVKSTVLGLSSMAPTKQILWTATMPHESLLGLMSGAKRVIGNSSALFFEGMYFKERCGTEILQVGVRNAVREEVLLKPGGAKRIAKRLKQWLA